MPLHKFNEKFYEFYTNSMKSLEGFFIKKFVFMQDHSNLHFITQPARIFSSQELVILNRMLF